jgi:hypothetical protein
LVDEASLWHMRAVSKQAEGDSEQRLKGLIDEGINSPDVSQADAVARVRGFAEKLAQTKQ